MSRICPLPGGLQIFLDRNQRIAMQRNPPELLSLADDIDDGLVPVGLEIPDLEAADFGLS